MNFSYKTLRRTLSLILAVVMTATLFAGCKKDDTTKDTSEPNLNLNLSDTSAPSETETEPTETTGPKINENTATVTSTLNIRSSPSTEATIVGTLEAGDKVEISRREGITGIDWAYIISPTSGWIVMEFVEMDIPSAEAPQEDTSTPAGDAAPEDTKNETTTNTTNIKAVVNANGLNIRNAPGTENTKVQGSYNKGDVVTILETKNGWGRTNKGWIKMEYVSTSGSTTTTNKTDTTTTTNTNVTGNGSTTVVAKGVVKANDLNIRSEASTSGDRLGNYTYGARVEFLEKSGSWGRTNKGWISLDYVYMDGNTGTKTATGTITASELLIRSGPGKDYASVGSYKSGDSVNVLEQFTYNGVTWGCTSKGWISMDYVNTGSNTTSTESKTGTITGNGLRIRSGAGTDFGTVGSLNSGDRVTILEQKIVDGTTWGKISQGWISMDYVRLD